MSTGSTQKKKRKREQLERHFEKIEKLQLQINETVGLCKALIFGETHEEDRENIKKKEVNFQQKKKKEEFLEKQIRIEKEHTISPEIQLLMGNWSSFATLSKSGTKNREKSIKTLKKIVAGSFFNRKDVPDKYKKRKFDTHEILKVFHKFDLMRNNTHYAPIDKNWTKNIHIHTFFWNEYSPTNKSLFLQLLTQDPTFAKKSAQVLTEEELFLLKLLCKKYNKIKKETKEEVAFVTAATKLNIFYSANHKKFKHSMNKAQVISFLFETVENKYTTWGIGHISTDLAFDRLKTNMKESKLL